LSEQREGCELVTVYRRDSTMNQHHRSNRRTRRALTGLVVGTVTAALVGPALGSAAVASPARAADRAHSGLGNRSLAQVLAADKGFDHNWSDFDILEKAVLTVLAAKPDSPVKVLTQGGTRLTAFIPTDRAFRRLVRDLTGNAPRTERGTFRAIAHLAGVDTLEAILLYHVVPGATVTSNKVVKLNGAALTTAQGGTVTVQIRGGNVRLVDQDHNARNPKVIAVDINKGNRQIAHAINRVLRPIDL
jgi:uncharacterized surface protein with fasciclin (FAS1) repeats